MLTDPISDFLIQIKNGYMARKENVVIPYSKIKEELANLLSKKGYLGKVQVRQKSKIMRDLAIDLIYEGKQPKLTDVVRVSKISRRVYVKKGKILKVLSGLGISVISTSSGLMVGSEARKKDLGGEIICKVW